MTVIETLTADQLISLQDAQDKITFEMLESLDYGDQIELNNDFCIYHYLEDDCIVINLIEEWEEVLQVLYSDTDIAFEVL